MTEATEFAANAVYTASETATILRISIDKLRQVVKDGELTPLRYAQGKSLFSGVELRRFIEAQS